MSEDNKDVTTEESLGSERDPGSPRFRASTLPPQTYVAPEMQGSHEVGSATPTPAWDGTEVDPADVPSIKAKPEEEVRLQPGTVVEEE